MAMAARGVVSMDELETWFGDMDVMHEDLKVIFFFTRVFSNTRGVFYYICII